MMVMFSLLLFCFSLPFLQAYNIAIVPKNLGNEDFFGLTFQGCQDAATQELQDSNVNCWFNGTWDADIEGTLQVMDELIDDENCSAIVVSVLDPARYINTINRGIAQGKPIFTFDSDAPDSNRLAYIGTDNYFMGRGLAKLLKETQPGGGRFGMVSGFGDNLSERVRGVRDVLDGSDWIEVGPQPKNGMEDIDISLQKMWELVEEYPDINAIVGVVGLPMFNKTSDNWEHFVETNSNVSTIMADTLPIQLELMQKGYADGLVGQLPYAMGYKAALTAVSVLDKVGQGISLEEALPEDMIYGTHQLEVLRVPAESNRTILPPIPPPDLTKAIQVEEIFIGVSVKLVGATEMSLQEKITFEELMASWFEGYFQKQATQTAEVANMDTSISVTRQDVTDSGNKITFDQTIAYLALEGALGPEDYLVLPYYTAQENRDFARILSTKISALKGIESPIAHPMLAVSHGQNGDFPTVLVVSVVAGALVVIFAIGALVYKKRGGKSTTPGHPMESTIESSSGSMRGSLAMHQNEDAAFRRPSAMHRDEDVAFRRSSPVHYNEEDVAYQRTETTPSVIAVAELNPEMINEDYDGFPAYKDQVRNVRRPKHLTDLPVANARHISEP